MLFQHEFPSLRLLPFHPLSLFSSLPLLSVSLFLYLYRYPRAPSPPILPLVHFMRPPAKENIPRLSSQLLLSRIFHRRATRGNDRDRGERERESYHTDCRAESLLVSPRRGRVKCAHREICSILCLWTLRSFDWPVDVSSPHLPLGFVHLINIALNVNDKSATNS